MTLPEVPLAFYPVAVLLLILVFRQQLHLAAIGWALLAFGDGVATLAGKAMGGGKLPWNRDKSWAGLLAFFGHATSEGFIRPDYLDLFLVAPTPGELLDRLSSWRPSSRGPAWLSPSQA